MFVYSDQTLYFCRRLNRIYQLDAMCMKNVWKRGILLGAACLPLWVGDMQAARKVPIAFEK